MDGQISCDLSAICAKDCCAQNDNNAKATQILPMNAYFKLSDLDFILYTASFKSSAFKAVFKHTIDCII